MTQKCEHVTALNAFEDHLDAAAVSCCVGRSSHFLSTQASSFLSLCTARPTLLLLSSSVLKSETIGVFLPQVIICVFFRVALKQSPLKFVKHVCAKGTSIAPSGDGRRMSSGQIRLFQPFTSGLASKLSRTDCRSRWTGPNGAFDCRRFQGYLKVPSS